MPRRAWRPGGTCPPHRAAAGLAFGVVRRGELERPPVELRANPRVEHGRTFARPSGGSDRSTPASSSASESRPAARSEVDRLLRSGRQARPRGPRPAPPHGPRATPRRLVLPRARHVGSASTRRRGPACARSAYSASPSIDDWRDGPHELLAREIVQRFARSSASGPRPSPTAPAQNTFPTTAASCRSSLRSAGSASSRAAISACTCRGTGSRRLPRAPVAPLDEQPAILQHPDELLGVERVAPRAFKDRLCISAGSTPWSRSRDEPRRSRRRERQAVRGRVAEPRGPARMPLVELRTCGTHDQQRNALRPVSDVLEELEQRVIRPVQVLEHEDGRTVVLRCPRGSAARR